MNRHVARPLAVALGLAAFVAPASVSYALWSTTATGTVTVTTAAPAVATPAAPTQLRCGTPVTGGSQTTSVPVHWNPASGATTYQLRNGSASYGAPIPGTTTTGSVVRSDLSNGTYTFTVVAVNAAGSSGPSNSLTFVRSGNSLTCSVTP